MTPARRTLLSVALLTAPLAIPGGAAFSAEWDLGGSASVEIRSFLSDPANADQNDSNAATSAALEPEFVYEWNGGDDRLTLTPFGRYDSDDENRTHADVRAASWLHIGQGWDMVAGVDRVFWGVTESRHLVDIVNQDDAVENPDGEDKLGQPMVNVNIESGYGVFGLYVLPGFRERTFPGGDARLRGPLPILDEATYDSGAGAQRVDFALRWAHNFGNWDLGLSYFDGTSREPRFFAGLDSGGQPVLIPHYDVIGQTGLELQYTGERWLWKLEAVSRTGHGERFEAAVGGFEYTFFGIFGTTADLGVISEYLYDGRPQDGSAPATAFDNDVFAGMRLALNDEQSFEILAGGIVDPDSGAKMASVEASRRIGNRWKAELEGRFFLDVPADDPLAVIAQDDFVTLRLSMFF